MPNVSAKSARRKERKMKKILIVVGVAALSLGAFARPHGGHCFRTGPGPRFHAPMHHHYHHHGGFWGRGGRNFWPGFVGGVVGGVLYDAIVPPRPIVTSTVVTPAPTVVVQQPVVTTPVVAAPVQQVQSVWVEGRYVDQVQANGTIVRVWQPGHYEQRTVYVQ